MKLARCVKNLFMFFTPILLLLQISCASLEMSYEEVESANDIPIILNLLVSFDGYQYELQDAELIDVPYKFESRPHLKILRSSGYRARSLLNDVLFDVNCCTSPVNGWVSLPFTNSLAAVEFYGTERFTDEDLSTPVITSFSREQILWLSSSNQEQLPEE